MCTKKRSYVAFSGHRLVARGELLAFVATCKEFVDTDPLDALLLFDSTSGYALDVDFRGTLEDVVARLPTHPMVGEELRATAPNEDAKRGRGRPKLGVVSREISLLPRHWEWLEGQPRSASATLRKLVDEARKAGDAAGEARRATEAIHRVMWALAGNLGGFEEASRALFAGDLDVFIARIEDWPIDLRDYLVAEVRTRLQQGVKEPPSLA
jgi:hypothetical protein